MLAAVPDVSSYWFKFIPSLAGLLLEFEDIKSFLIHYLLNTYAVTYYELS
jgi:hypothetical protein